MAVCLEEYNAAAHGDITGWKKKNPAPVLVANNNNDQDRHITAIGEVSYVVYRNNRVGVQSDMAVVINSDTLLVSLPEKGETLEEEFYLQTGVLFHDAQSSVVCNIWDPRSGAIASNSHEGHMSLQSYSNMVGLKPMPKAGIVSRVFENLEDLRDVQTSEADKGAGRKSYGGRRQAVAHTLNF